MIQTTMIDLNKLRSGEAVNVRRTDRDEGVKALGHKVELMGDGDG